MHFTQYLCTLSSLQKGPGYHVDMFLVGVMIFVHSVMGLPWVVGSTILSISHVQSLHRYRSSDNPGEAPNFLGVRWAHCYSNQLAFRTTCPHVCTCSLYRCIPYSVDILIELLFLLRRPSKQKINPRKSGYSNTSRRQ